MKSTRWVLVDTETSGLRNPVYCVEIAAQLMSGLVPDGPRLRLLLNHDVDIERSAESLHGYSREYLKAHGMDPYEAHRLFRDYVGSLPIVAFNLSYDWCRVLEPEYKRLSLPIAGTPGFCALTLARRCLFEVTSHKLESLGARFLGIQNGVAHKASADLGVTMQLMIEVMWPRLERAGITRYRDIEEFSRTTPIARCVERIRRVGPTVDNCRPHSLVFRGTDPASELCGLIKGILADDILVDAEVWSLFHWLNAHSDYTSAATDRLRDVLKQVFEDGTVSESELARMRQVLATFVE